MENSISETPHGMIVIHFSGYSFGLKHRSGLDGQEGKKSKLAAGCQKLKVWHFHANLGPPAGGTPPGAPHLIQ